MMVTVQYRWKSERRRARKETNARRVMAKESMAKVWESTTNATSTAKTLINGKGNEKGIEKRKERQRKKTRKRREASTKFEFPRLPAGHVASGGKRRVSVGKDTCKPWKKFRVLLRVHWRQVQ